MSGVDRGSCGHSCCFAAGVGIPVGAENATVYRQRKGKVIFVSKKIAGRILTDESPKWPGETHL